MQNNKQLNEIRSLIDRMENPRTGWGEILESPVRHTIYSDALVEETELKISDYFDLSKISEEDLKSIAYDIRSFFPSFYGMRLHESGDELVVETVENFINADDLFKELQKFGFKNWQIESRILANNIKTAILYADVSRNTDTILKIMESLGWSKARISAPHELYGIMYRAIEFDPMKQDTITDIVRNKYSFLYHLTPQENLEMIMQNGLEARTENNYLDYPPRTHLLKEDITINQMSYFGWELFSKRTDNLTDYVLLRIVVDDIPQNIEFYGDPRFELGVFCKDIIPSTAITTCGYVTYLNKNKYSGEKIKLL